LCVVATESIKAPDNVAKQRGGIVSQWCGIVSHGIQ
jgi:hypothetical protein